MDKAHKYLSQVKTLDDEIRTQKDKSAELKEAACTVGTVKYDEAKVKSKKLNCKIENLVLKYVLLDKQIEKQEKRFKYLVRKISGQIGKLPDEKDREILKLIYLDYVAFADIAEKYDTSRKTVYRWQDRALENFSNLFF